MKGSKKVLIYITVFFIFLSSFFLILGVIGIASGNNGDFSTFSFYGTIICLLFALIFKPGKII